MLLSPCSCGNGGSGRFRDCPGEHSSGAYSSGVVESGQPHSKPQACPQGLSPPLQQGLSPRTLAWTSPRSAPPPQSPPQSPPNLPSPCWKPSDVITCVRLLSGTAGTCHRSPHHFPALIPQHFMLRWQLLCTSHALSRPHPPAGAPDPFHPVPSSFPGRVAALLMTRWISGASQTSPKSG